MMLACSTRKCPSDGNPQESSIFNASALRPSRHGPCLSDRAEPENAGAGAGDGADGGAYIEVGRALWWALVIIASAAVLAAELFNTAIERLADHLHPEMHPEIRIVKDCAAAAVL